MKQSEQNKIEGWMIDIRNFEDPMTDRTNLQYLDPDRQEKVLRFRRADDRKRSLVAGLLIRQIIEQAGGTISDLRYTTHQKPYVEGIYFNVSHSGNYVVGVASPVINVACDIELIRVADRSLMKHCFSEEEQAYVLGSGSEDEKFYEIWTRKESIIKLRGGTLNEIRETNSLRTEIKLYSNKYDGHMVTVAADGNILMDLASFHRELPAAFH